MPSSRWIIFRRLSLVLLVGVGVAWAARKAKTEPEVAAPPPAPESVATPALPVAAPLFPGSLPLAEQAVPDGIPSLSAQACNACHGAVHDAWAGSAHARAWNDAAFRAALARVGETTACTGCHLPLANQHPRLAAGYVQGDPSRPDMQPNAGWDPTLMSEGVTCAACHVRDGKVLVARPDARGGPHPIAYSEELGKSELCATCHQLSWPEGDRPFYDTWGEWQQSAYAQAGVGCVDCHMPQVPAASSGTRFAAVADHGLPADPARALSIHVRTGAPEIQRGSPFAVTVKLQNTGAGHHLPTGSPFQAWRVVVLVRDVDGKVASDVHKVDLQRQVETAPPWRTLSDNRLAAGAELLLEHSFTVDQRKKAGRGTLEVAVYPLDAAALADPKWTPDKAGPPRVRQQIPLPIL
ncbi:hypothetical protein L6R53_30055 [Myxococcota bacterium]|nr:hypothetical protein [Myxococcota bacterium]